MRNFLADYLSVANYVVSATAIDWAIVLVKKSKNDSVPKRDNLVAMRDYLIHHANVAVAIDALVCPLKQVVEQDFVALFVGKSPLIFGKQSDDAQALLVRFLRKERIRAVGKPAVERDVKVLLEFCKVLAHSSAHALLVKVFYSI